MSALIQQLSRYVAIPSVSKQEAALADAAAADLHAAGLRVQRQGNNVWCELGDAPRPRLLLNSHLDTVPAAAGWWHDPWQPQVSDGRLSGLGANDAKGCVVAMIAATLAVHGRLARGGNLGGTLVLALTAEEETSGAGLSTILDRLRPLDAALVGEPTGLTPMIAQRGLLILRGVARGRAAHPANMPPESADNAIQRAAAALQRLHEFDWGPEHPLLGRCHGHVTRIVGGTALNVIPDTCEFWLDIRTVPGESHQQLYERLRGFLCQLDRVLGGSVESSSPPPRPSQRGGAPGALEGGGAPGAEEHWQQAASGTHVAAARRGGCSPGKAADGAIKLHIHSERLVPVETCPETPIVQAVLRALPGSRLAGSPAMSDMVFLAGVPAVKIGPGDTRRSHTPDEYVTVDELSAGMAAYERIVCEYFGKPT